jgi:hypothetical protein
LREVQPTVKCGTCGWLTHEPEPYEDGTPKLPIGWKVVRGRKVCGGKRCAD